MKGIEVESDQGMSGNLSFLEDVQKPSLSGVGEVTEVLK